VSGFAAIHGTKPIVMAWCDGCGCGDGGGDDNGGGGGGGGDSYGMV
jgi:hypothetical protein